MKYKKAHIALRLVGNKGKLGYVYAFGEWDKANDDMENSGKFFDFFFLIF